jgi:hypothetical protein
MDAMKGGSDVVEAPVDKFAVFRKMLTAGVPEGAVRRKMELSGMSAPEIAELFVADAAPTPSNKLSAASAPLPAQQLPEKEVELPRAPTKESHTSNADLLLQIRGGAKLRPVKACVSPVQMDSTRSEETQSGSTVVKTLSSTDQVSESNQSPCPFKAPSNHDLLNAIRGGVQLRRVKPNDGVRNDSEDKKHSPNDNNRAPFSAPPGPASGQGSMMRVLADALTSRRQRIRRDDSICSNSSQQW